ncbi:MAG: 16S rRNA (cytosine(1402)-N(4))-methyltransferase RsmH [Phycisphaerae bacterium]
MDDRSRGGSNQEDQAAGDVVEHEPVLTTHIVDRLAPVIGRLWVDATLGLGGHAAALLEVTPSSAKLVAFDVDARNLNRARERLTAWSGRVNLVRANFADLAETLDAISGSPVDAILADLGPSNNQLLDPQIGLSFDRDAPLDMRLDERLTETAAELVNHLPESRLADLLYVESQEPRSRRIARAICSARRDAPIGSSGLLARIVARAVGGRRGRIHPATLTFLALRRTVNREGAALDALLQSAPLRLRTGGRIAVISFHSGEDRVVKSSFRAWAERGVLRILTRRPVTADAVERRRNRRSRSAKLRVAERTERDIDEGTTAA